MGCGAGNRVAGSVAAKPPLKPIAALPAGRWTEQLAMAPSLALQLAACHGSRQASESGFAY